MKDTKSIDLEALESRLGVKVPRFYREYVHSMSALQLAQQGFDPKTLLVLNLELKELEHYENIRERFFLNGDGCGNYYFIDVESDEDTILLWSDDPPGIEHRGDKLATYLPEAEQVCRIDIPIRPGDRYICRTKAYAESILDPISLEEWIDAVNSTDGVKYLGYSEYKSPFTGELIRSEQPGLTAILGQPNVQIRVLHGRAWLIDSFLTRSIARALANKLAANVLDCESGKWNDGT